MADIGHDKIPYLVTRKEMSSAKAAERNGEIGSCDAVDYSGKKIEPRRTVYGDKRNGEVVNAPKESLNGRTRSVARARPQERIDNEAYSGPRSIG